MTRASLGLVRPGGTFMEDDSPRDTLYTPDSLHPSGYSHIVSRSISSYNIDTENLYGTRNKFILHIVAIVSSGISLFAATISFYWFYRMRKRFRHKLINLMILGDIIRVLWYLIFSCISFYRPSDRVPTASALCQTTGFFVQWGTEIADIAVLFLAIHGALRVFRPSVSAPGSGSAFYRRRRYIYVCIIGVPLLFAALPWSNPHSKYAYISQGAFCSLPIRPLWYRLTLAWIPRFMIWLALIGLSIAVYVRVRTEFKTFTKDTQQTAQFRTDGFGGADAALHPDVEKQRDSIDSMLSPREPIANPLEAYVPAAGLPSRPERSVSPPVNQANAPAVGPDPGTIFSAAPIFADSIPNTRVRISVPDSIITAATKDRHRKSSVSFSSWRHLLQSQDKDCPSRRMSCRSLYTTSSSQPEDNSSSSAAATAPAMTRRTLDPLDRRMADKRRHIQRQLRSLFVYPVIYIVMWLPPFVMLLFQFNDAYARHPPFPLAALATTCPCGMGAINSLVFSVRERPWRDIPGRGPEGGFWESFAFWRQTGRQGASGGRGRRRGSSSDASSGGGEVGGAESETATSPSMAQTLHPPSSQLPTAAAAAAATATASPSLHRARPWSLMRTATDLNTRARGALGSVVSATGTAHHAHHAKQQPRRASMAAAAPAVKEWWERCAGLSSGEEEDDDENIGHDGDGGEVADGGDEDEETMEVRTLGGKGRGAGEGRRVVVDDDDDDDDDYLEG